MQGIIPHILHDPKLELNISSISDVEAQIRQYLGLLLKWNKKINLTAEKDADNILKRHVFDSLQYSRALRNTMRVMDIGSGAGFPGIPLKIIFPELSLVLVESQRKRCSFLETVVRDLGLGKVEVINSRAEDIPNHYEGQFDAVIFRAVSGLQACLTLGGRFVSPGGRVVLKKPPEESSSVFESRLLLQEEISITNYYGLVSSLMIFE